MDRSTRALLAVVCGVAVSSVYVGQPLLGPMGADLGVAPGSVGWFVAVGQLGYLAGLVLLVPLGDLLDRRRLLATQLALVALGATITALAPQAWIAFAGLALAGLFATVVQTTVAYAAAVSPDGERGRNLGVVTSGVVIGILGSRVAAGVLADTWGWRSAYAVLAALAALLAAASLARLSPDSARPTSSYLGLLRSFAGLFGDPVFVRRGLLALLVFASFGTLWSGLALPLAAAPWHLDETRIGLFGLVGLAGALGAARAGRWADASHAGLVTGAAIALLAASWLAIGQLPRSLVLVVVGIVVLDLAVQAVHVSNQHVLATRFADRTSTTIGAYMAFYSVGSAAGAAATTSLYESAGWAGPTTLGLCLALAAFVVWGSGLRRRPARA